MRFFLFLLSSPRWRLKMCLTVPSGSPRAWAMRLLPQPFSWWRANTFSSTSDGVRRGLWWGRRDRSTRPASPSARKPLPHRIAGDGESARGFLQAPALLPSVHDPEPQDHFALRVGELPSFGEGECQRGRIPPFGLVWMNLRIGGMPHFFKNSPNAPKSGLRGGSPCPGLFTRSA